MIKPNQIGTLTETLEAIACGASAATTPRSSRSAPARPRTRASATLAVTTGSTQIKAGAPSRERVAKYNRLLRIEEMLGPDAKFAG